MMLRTSMLKRIGLLDDRSFLFLEELILAEKLRDTDFKSMLVPASRVRHEGGKSTKTMPVGQARYFLQSLNLYLRNYRRVGAVRRFLILCGPVVYYIPSILKTIMGLRRPQ
jgi:GT2 family glycosyltransferase